MVKRSSGEEYENLDLSLALPLLFVFPGIFPPLFGIQFPHL